MSIIKKLLILTLMGLLLLPAGGVAMAAPVTGYPAAGYVLVPHLNVRSGPGTNFAIVTALRQGQSVPLIGRNGAGSWLQIGLPYQQKGWVFGQYVSVSPDVLANLPVTDTYDIPSSPAVGYVTSFDLNVRTGPGLNYPLAGRLRRGEQVLLLGRNSGSTWLQIRLSAYSKGWVSANYIHSVVPISSLPVADVSIPEPPPAASGYVLAYRLNVRSGPGFNHWVVGQLRHGQQVMLIGRDHSGNWLKIELADGRQGWVAAQFISTPVPAA